MSEVIDNSTATPTAVPVGQRLRAAREQAGLSLKEVAAALYLTRQKLTALENDEHDLLPSAVFVQGYLRKYAKLLNLDGEALVSDYNQRRAAGTDREPDWQPPTPAFPSARLPSWLGPAGMVAAVVVIVAVVINKSGEEDEAAPAPVAAREAPQLPATPPITATNGLAVEIPDKSTAPLQQAPGVAENSAAASNSAVSPQEEALPSVSMAADTSPAPLAAADRLAFDFLDDCWVEVADANGTIIHASLAGAGETLALNGEAPFSITLGNARGVSLSLNGAAVAIEPRTGRRTAKLTVGE